MAGRTRRKRFEDRRDARFLTFSCLNSAPLLESDWAKDIAVEQLALTHDRLGFKLYAWVVMPNHVHLLLWPDIDVADIRRIMSAYKTRVSKRVHDYMRAIEDPLINKALTSKGEFRLWQGGGGYDRNIWSGDELEEKINYIEDNPVRAGLAPSQEQYKWSSVGSDLFPRDDWR